MGILRSFFEDSKLALAFYLSGSNGNVWSGGDVPVPTGDWVTRVTDTVQGYLTDAEMEHNATFVWAYFRTNLQWNVNSVASLLGNMQGESTLNPGLIEVGGGTTSAGPGGGLVQWTPRNDLYKVLDRLYGKHDDWYDGNKQLAVIFAEYQEASGEAHRGIEKQWYATNSYPISFKQWAFNELNYSVEQLTYAFAANYLRPAVVQQPERVKNALKWLAFFNKG